MEIFLGDMFKWWLVSVIIGVIAFPVSFVLFKKSHDKGYMFSKAVGIFLIAYFSWFLGHFAFSTATVLAVIVLFLGVSVYLAILNKKEILDFINEKAVLIILTEGFYLFIFVAYAFFRMHQPDIFGSEKFMDFAFMNSISRADRMPPYDPWMYGKGLYICYYYFGYFIAVVMLKLTGISGEVGFNLALAYIFAMSAVCMTGLLYNLTRNYAIGLLAAAFLLLAGNIDGFIQVASKGWTTDGFNWLHSSRIIDYGEYDMTINEFPFFSFLLGDMHPHQMAIPFVLLALNIALYFIKEEDENLVGKKAGKLLFLVFSGLVFGGLWFLNSWDVPTYFFIAVLCILSYKYARGERVKVWIKDAAPAAGIMLVVAIVAYLPFTFFFESQVKGIGLVKANTKITDYLTIYGIMLFPIFSFVVFRVSNWVNALRAQGIVEIKTGKKAPCCPGCGTEIAEENKVCGQCGYRISGDEPKQGDAEAPGVKMNDMAVSFFKFLLDPAGIKDKRVILYSSLVAGLSMAIVVYKTLMDKPNVGAFAGLAFLALAIVFLMGLTRVELKENQFVIILVFTGLLASLGCEILYIADTFSSPGTHNELERMNTVFKFYYQVWILFSVAAAYGFFWVKNFYLAFRPKPVRRVWYSIFIILIAMGMFYPVIASYVKTGGFKGRLTLDGIDFLKRMSYKGRLPALGDYRAIEWLKKNVKGSPVILEACGPVYSEFARISSFTGLPTVLGWPGHERQWRGSWYEAGKRQADVNTIYAADEINQALLLIKKYEIQYIYVGALERDKYEAIPASLEKFSRFMDIVYADDAGTVIYKMK